MSMPMSLPFALSSRRRSHSASSPSPSPAPTSLWRPAHKRAHSSHREPPMLPDSQRCHLDIWRTGKRPRRDTPVTRSSTPASADSRSTSSCSSTPRTPHFPASSADFLLFSGHPIYGGNSTIPNPHSPSSAVACLNEDTCGYSKSDLARLRSAAFSELQRSVQENGEGLVKRMREFEDSRSKSAQHSRVGGRRRRKHHSPSAPTYRATRKYTSSDDDDVLILSNGLGAELLHPRQKRSSSLGAMDDSESRFHNDPNSSGRLSPISGVSQPVPLVQNALRMHSSSNNQSSETPIPFSTSFDFTNSLHTNTFKPSSSYSSDSLASPSDMCPPLFSPTISPPQSPYHSSSDPIISAASSAEKAIAALTLAMANGAGGLEDYEAVRALDTSLGDESQIGELWH